MTDGGAAAWMMLLLGAYHGLNPAMGWLFAVALGLQHQRARAVAWSLVPIAIGHMFAVGAVVAAAALAGVAVPVPVLRAVAAASLIGLGVRALTGHRHPRWVRMQVGFRDLTAWSFMMASAHGAGVMLLPVVLRGKAVDVAAATAAHSHVSFGDSTLTVLSAVGIHTVAYLVVTGLIAWVVYRKIGLAILRQAWFNFDLAWGAALVITGVATVLV
jgi:hypothetical protein